MEFGDAWSWQLRGPAHREDEGELRNVEELLARGVFQRHTVYPSFDGHATVRADF